MTSIISQTLRVQKITIGVASVAFVGLLYLLFTTDPFSASYFLWIFFGGLVIFFAAIYLLLIFVWQFNIRKFLMNWNEVINSIYYAIVLSCATVFGLILAMVEQLNIISITVILFGLVLYWFANN
jgi:carbon starvation protein CstA